MSYTYRVLLTGQLMTDRFRYPAEKRVTVCTTTLLQGSGMTILVDPGWHDAMLLEALSDCGVGPEQIDTVYLTHLHADHIRSIHLFPDAKWLAPGKEIEWFRPKIAEEDRYILNRLAPAGNMLHDGIHVIETPGHTMGHTSLLFHSEGRRILVAGDAVLTKDYYAHLEVHPNSEDTGCAVRTMLHIADLCDWIIPGHDRPFFQKEGKAADENQ